ncbi:MAG TPA: 50S ribosomal protein L9 [Candidatus Paceibacterota bacterium]|jgi:large subunit ribosomal protein L9|nr:50S ribosomal protein L9 [Candidatus Paceibacterota bacterium]
MKVILLKSVPKVGKKDDIVTVADGYGQNVLLPKRMAVVATEQAVAALKRTQQNNVTKKEIQHSLLDKAIDEVINKTLTYKVKTNEKGSLFSKIDERDISKALFDQHRVDIDPKLLTIEGGAIKEIGSYTVTVKEGSYTNSFTLEVTK